MPKIVIDSDEYFKIKEKLNKLSETNKSLKEKYVRLQKRSAADIGCSIEAFNKEKNENENLRKNIEVLKQENINLEKEKIKLMYDIKLFKKDSEELKKNIKNLTDKNNQLNSMIEEFENRKKTKVESESKKTVSKKEEFDINKFNSEYLEFIEKLKENSKK